MTCPFRQKALSSLTPNQHAHLAEWDELHTFRDEVFDCRKNVFPSCLCAFLCPFVHLGQMASRLGVTPCWLPPLVLFFFLGLVFYIDRFVTEALFLLAWTGLIWAVRLKVRRYFRPAPGMIGDFSQLPGHLDDCCLDLWCGCCSIAQLSRHVGNYQLHQTGFTNSNLEEGESLL